MDEVKRERRCENCIYWLHMPELPIYDGEGACHKNPPPHGKRFPLTYRNDFCGEHRLEHPKDKL